MPKLTFTRHVPDHSPEEMLRLVADVRTYPGFVPNCTAMEVTPDRAAPERVCEARMSVQFGPLAQAYTSRVTVDPDAGTISAKALDGPFSHLDSKWTFAPEGAGALISFEIDFGFSNPFVARVAEPAFAAKQEEIVDAFLREADRRYSKA